MECSKANELMMKYMDGALSEADAERLHKHIAQCDMCKADFMIYDEIVSEFSTLDEAPAPDGFVDAVMAKIGALETESASAKASVKADNILVTVWGIFTVLLGLGFVLALNRDAVSTFLASQPALAGYMETLAPLGVMVGDFAAGITAVTQDLFAQAAVLLADVKYVILGIAACLALAPVVLSVREKRAVTGRKKV